MKVTFYKIVELLNEFIDSVAKLFRASRADKLLIAAFLVATLRQMGVNGHFIGFDPATQWPWFQPLEVFSGLALALLEGLALAYVSRRWRKLEPKNKTEWTYWVILLFGQLGVLMCLVFYVALYAHAAQRELLVHQAFSEPVNMIWNFSVALVIPLIVILIGIVDDTPEQEDEMHRSELISEEEEAWLALTRHIQRFGNKRLTPPELAELSNVSMPVAAKVLGEATRLNMFEEVS